MITDHSILKDIQVAENLVVTVIFMEQVPQNIDKLKSILWPRNNFTGRKCYYIWGDKVCKAWLAFFYVSFNIYLEVHLFCFRQVVIDAKDFEKNI